MTKTCTHGHPINTRNSYLDSRGRRQCRVCQRIRARERYAREFRSLQTGHVVLSERT